MATAEEDHLSPDLPEDRTHKDFQGHQSPWFNLQVIPHSGFRKEETTRPYELFSFSKSREGITHTVASRLETTAGLSYGDGCFSTIAFASIYHTQVKPGSDLPEVARRKLRPTSFSRSGFHKETLSPDKSGCSSVLGRKLFGGTTRWTP
jgi:hypothetical protein